MRVQVVRHYPHRFRFGVPLVYQHPHRFGKVHCRALFSDRHLPSSHMRFEHPEQVARPLPHVLIVFTLQHSRLPGQGWAGMIAQLIWQLVETNPIVPC